MARVLSSYLFHFVFPFLLFNDYFLSIHNIQAPGWLDYTTTRQVVICIIRNPLSADCCQANVRRFIVIKAQIRCCSCCRGAQISTVSPKVCPICCCQIETNTAALLGKDIVSLAICAIYANRSPLSYTHQFIICPVCRTRSCCNRHITCDGLRAIQHHTRLGWHNTVSYSRQHDLTAVALRLIPVPVKSNGQLLQKEAYLTVLTLTGTEVTLR